MSGGLRVKPSGSWEVRFYVDGKRKSKSFASREDAETFAAGLPPRGPLAGGPALTEAEWQDRILGHVSQDPETSCWIWEGYVNVDGYGRVGGTGAHRRSYQAFVAPIPAGLHLDHLCRVRDCVNPDHLEPVTAQENILRSPIAPAALNAEKTHCGSGHEFTPENTYVYRRHRRCMICTKARRRERRLERSTAAT